MQTPRYTILFLALAWLLNGCGAKPAMQGADGNGEEGTVQESSPHGGGDTTSFSGSNVEKVDEYVVRPGDNLWNIAAKASVYHSGWLYPLIVKLNRSKIKDPKNLPVGLTLKIPRGLPQADYDVAREEAMAGVYESDSGPLLEMKTSLPVETLMPGADAGKQAPTPKKGGKHWLIWTALAAAVAGGAWWLMRMRGGPSGGESPPA
jgi:hypothetical protein